MDLNLNIGQLEGAINRCKLAEPFSNGILPADLRLMASLYGEMIFHRIDNINVSIQPALLQAVLAKWTIRKDSDFGPQAEAVCSLQPGDAGLDGCEACQ
jgi:hypothetical protein